MPIFNSDPQLKRAFAYCTSQNIPEDAYQAYRSQRNGARRRSIEFVIEFADWWNWWQVDDPEHGIRWEKRGVGKDKLVMARYGDIGPYSLDNIYCTSHSKNILDVDPEKRSKAQKAAWEDVNRVSHLAVRGDGHPISKAVITPDGRFGSAALAADHYGITRSGASKKAKKRIHGWYFEGENPPEIFRGQIRRKKRAVITPDGKFESLQEAASHYGINVDAARSRATQKIKGWSFID